MAGQASISTDILARYAADAACEVEGVRGLAESPLPGRRGVKVSAGDGGVRVELHLAVEWGASIPELGRGVQARVRGAIRLTWNIKEQLPRAAVPDHAAAANDLLGIGDGRPAPRE